jgi:hypothetical protein
VLKAGDLVAVSRNGKEITGYIDHIKGNEAWVDLDSSIDGILHMYIPLSDLRPVPTKKRR